MWGLSFYTHTQNTCTTASVYQEKRIWAHKTSLAAYFFIEMSTNSGKWVSGICILEESIWLLFLSFSSIRFCNCSDGMVFFLVFFFILLHWIEIIFIGSGPLIPYGLPCVRELFRFLISLTNPLDRHNTDVMIHMGLSLLAVAFESGADHIGQYESLLFLVKDEMCRHLFLVSIVYFKINRMIVGFTSTYAINAYHH